MSDEPKTLTPQAMTLEEGLAAIFPDAIGKRNDGKWPFFTYVSDNHGHTCTAIFDSWPDAVSWAKGVPVVARDETALTYRGQPISVAEAQAILDVFPQVVDNTREIEAQILELRNSLRRLVGGGSEKGSES